MGTGLELNGNITNNSNGSETSENMTNTNPSISDNTGNNDASASMIKNKPKLIISNYKLSSEMVKAGDEFELDLEFYNTNSEKSVRNIKITLNGQEQSQTATGQQASGSVFTPVNSSNTFYIPYIAAESTSSKSITLRTVPTASAQNYTIQVAFEYEDVQGNEFTANEVIGVPVVQKTEMLFGDINMEGAILGGEIPLEFEFYNVGKDNLSRFMINVEGEGFTKLNSRYFVGNFQAGQTDRYSGTIIPTKSGELSGNVIVTYDDSTGKSHEHKIPFKTVVEEKPETNETLPVDPNTGLPYNPDDPTLPSESGGIMSYLPYIGIAAALLLITVFFLYRRNKKKREEQDLSIDEE